jgi:hypothetical protein
VSVSVISPATPRDIGSRSGREPRERSAFGSARPYSHTFSGRLASYLTAIAGVVGLVMAIVGAIAGLSAYALYTADVIGVDASATLIIMSVLSALAAVPIGLVAWRQAKKRGQESNIALSGLFVAVGTLGSWFVVVTVALGK